MKEIVLLGLNHKTAPVELRERLALSEEEASESLIRLHKNTSVSEVIIFSTCNRVEVLMASEDSRSAIKAVNDTILKIKDIHSEKLEKAFYTYFGEDAVKHVFRVAASLDSLVIGEPQILGQIKGAYRLATRHKTSGVILNRLLHRTFLVAKKIRSETGIGGSAVSISYAAIELAKKIFGTLEGKKVLLIGAGEMAELAVEHLIRNNVTDVFVANRTFPRALVLSERFKGKAIRMEEIAEILKTIDVVLSSTGSPEYIITNNMVKQTMKKRKNRPIFFIDIAVPRDIDPEVNRLNNAYVYDIDDLKDVIDENMEERKKEAIKGERIVDEAVVRFQDWYKNLEVIPTIVSLRNKLNSIAQAEIKKACSSLPKLPDEEIQAITRMMDSIIQKFMHDPTLFLKGNRCHGDKAVYIDATRKLFNLDE